MFHIKSDKRSQTSAQLIVDGLYKCMKEKPFSEISITDIQRKSTVGRATFYRHFDSLPDVLAYECDRMFQNLVAEGNDIRLGKKEDAFIYLFTCWSKNLPLLEAIIDCNHIELLYQVFRGYTDDLKLILVPDIDLTPDEVDYFVSISVSAIIGVLVAWIKHGKHDTPVQLAEIFKKSMKTIYISMREN